MTAFVVDCEEVVQLVVQVVFHSISNHQSGVHNDPAGAVMDPTRLIERQLFTALKRIDPRVKKNFVRSSAQYLTPHDRE